MTPPTTPDTTPPMDALIDQIVESYRDLPRVRHLDASFLPSRSRIIELIEIMRRLIFPGFFDDVRVTSTNAAHHIGALLEQADRLTYEQVRQALRYREDPACTAPQRERRSTNGQANPSPGDANACDTRAREITNAFLAAIPNVRRLLSTDVEATFQGDPASVSTDETIFCYPGIDAVFIHRVAHEMYNLGVPLVARIMSEYAHNETGIDIHPGASIGESFCIDHGTGIVVGETSTIGDRVKLYQNVTLGALSTKGGQNWKGMKRHPAIEDDVTIYGGAVILGGQTVIGKGATIGGAVFITSSVPPGHTVTMKQPELVSRPPRNRRKADKPEMKPDFDPVI